MTEDLQLQRLPSPKRIVLEEERSNIAEIKFVNDNLDKLVYIYLSTGVKLECYILSYDGVSFITTQKSNPRKTQLVYKNHIITIVVA